MKSNNYFANQRSVGKRRLLLLALVFLLAIILRDTWLSAIAVWGVVPDILIYFPVFIGMYSDVVNAAIYGAAVGLIEDLLSGKYIGLSVLARTAAAVLAAFLGNKLYKENIYNPPFIVLCCSAFFGLIYILLSYLVGLNLPLSLFVFEVLPQALYTALCTPLIAIPLFLILGRDRNRYL